MSVRQRGQTWLEAERKWDDGPAPTLLSHQPLSRRARFEGSVSLHPIVPEHLLLHSGGLGWPLSESRTQKTLSTSKPFLCVPFSPDLSHIISVCHCDVFMNECAQMLSVYVRARAFMCVCVCARAQTTREEGQQRTAPGLRPDQSRVCQSAGTQTASLYTPGTAERRGHGTEREVGVERLRSDSITLP